MANEELFVLDGLSFNDAALILEEVDLTPPSPRPEWAQGADSDGALLVRDPLFENRVIRMKVRVAQKATMLLAAQAIAGISRKLQECEMEPDGLPLVWTPADGTVVGKTFYVLSGSITELPVSWEGLYFAKSPIVTLELTCKPHGYGAEVVLSAVSSTEPVLTLTVANVPGDVPAEGRLIVTDPAGTAQARRTVEWGLEQRYYNAATSLLIDSDSLVTAGYSGTGNTRTGAYDPGAVGNSVVRALVGTIPSAVCSTGDQSHVGSFRVRARIFSVGTASTKIRLTWQDGDGPLNSNAYATVPVPDAWCEVDLGIITITPARIGAQRWLGRLDAFGATGVVETLDVDYLRLVPTEGYGRARGPNVPQVGIAVGQDGFGSAVDGSVLNARVAEIGGSWVTSGVATDFTALTQRTGRNTTTEATPRFAILGSGTYANVNVSAVVTFEGARTLAWRSGLIARWTDSNNYLAAVIRNPNVGLLQIVQVIAGVETVLAAVTQSVGTSTVQLTVTTSGAVTATFGTVMLGATSAALATGGTLATGKVGITDRAVTAATNEARMFDNFAAVETPPSIPAIYPGRTIEFRSDGSALRQNAAGTTYGQAPSYRGSRFMVPAAGDKNRTSRVVVSAARNDLDAGAHDPLADNLTAQIAYVPRWLVVRG
mgnify:CR=1 FL=1